MRDWRSNPSRSIAVLAMAALAACSDTTTTAPAPGRLDADHAASLHAAPMAGPPTLLVDGLEGASGSAVGPDHQLYVTEGAAGRVSRIDPQTGDVTTFASGLPGSIIGIGGAIDVAFLNHTAYVLVTLVDDPALFPTGQVNGIYRVDGPNTFTVIADIGAYNIAHPPSGFDYFVSTGVLYSFTPYLDGFLVTDGHLNRVLRVRRNGDISIYRSYGDIVPTGIDNNGQRVYLTEAGPVPHEPENGRILALGWGSSDNEVASGCRLCVDVKIGRSGQLFGLAQGVFPGGDPGSPASPNTGELLQIHRDGSHSTIADGLNQPTSMELIGGTAYIVSLAGQVWTVGNVEPSPPGWQQP